MREGSRTGKSEGEDELDVHGGFVAVDDEDGRCGWGAGQTS